MNRHERRTREKLTKRYLEHSNKAQSDTLQPIPSTSWPETRPSGLTQVWRSRNYLVQVYETGFPGVLRLTVCRTQINFDTGRWTDKIPWDDLQRLKRECGYGDQDALEVYPSDQDIVNVANHRHLWVMPEKVPFAWRKKAATAS